jgi:hypothetical protein
MDSRLRGNDTELVSPQGEFETRPYTSRQRVCRGAKPLCRGLGGVLGALHAPLQGYAITMQQNAAGVWGVPRSFIPPKNGGQGVERGL